MTILIGSKLKITLIRSYAGQSDSIRKILRSLGLTKINSSHILPNVKTTLGQINKVIQFIKVEAIV